MPGLAQVEHLSSEAMQPSCRPSNPRDTNTDATDSVHATYLIYIERLESHLHASIIALVAFFVTLRRDLDPAGVYL